MKKVSFLLLAGLALAGASEASAQVQGQVSIDIGPVAYISVPSPDVAFNTPTGADFSAGSIAANNSVTIDYGSNAPHELQIEFDGLGFGTKAVGDLQWSLDNSSFTPMTTSAVTMVTNGAAGITTGEEVFFQMMLDFLTDVPGTYSGTITYTVTAN